VNKSNALKPETKSTKMDHAKFVTNIKFQISIEEPVFSPLVSLGKSTDRMAPVLLVKNIKFQIRISKVATKEPAIREKLSWKMAVVNPVIHIQLPIRI